MIKEISVALNKKFDQDYKFYNPVLFAILGPFTPFAISGILFSLNAANGSPKKVKNILILLFIISNIVLYSAVIIIGPILGKNGNIFATVNTSIGISLFILQKNKYKIFKSNGGNSKDLLVPIIISVLIFTAVLINGFINPISNAWEYKDGRTIVYYDRDIKKDEIKELVNLLKKIGFIDEEQDSLFKIEFRNDKYHFLYPVKDEYINSDLVKQIKDEFEKIVNGSKILEKEILFYQSDEKYEPIELK